MTSYGYDVQDHLVSVTDGEGTTTTYNFSDRDVMTEEDSPVSGVTAHAYDEHGSLTSTTDARAVTATRTYDAADRMTFVDYPDPILDTTYTYDDPGVAFSQGRLTAITRDGLSVDYEYDRFGRTTRDGELTYAYDKNGNRIEIGYPGGEVARYTHDFADREATLELEPVGGSPEPVVTSTTYYAGGPLASLELGNGLTETRVYDQRYHPTRITVAPTGGGAALLDWAYTTDDVGNPTFIDDLLGGVDRQYGYQDVQYYLTQGDGPWGTLAWTYDRIGNRLSESRDGAAADVYTYQPNSGALGNTAQLTSIQHGSGGTTAFSYDAAGNQTQTNASGSVTDWTYDDASRLSQITRDEATSSFLYDGRSYLRFAESKPNTIFCDGFESGDTSNWGVGPGTCSQGQEQETVPTYTSDGVLLARHRQPSQSDPEERTAVLYFAGRPVAQLRQEIGGPSGWIFLSTDHLGTPGLATDLAASGIWHGPFEPFGADFLRGSSESALAKGVFLRFSGQWEDLTWNASTLGPETYYNLHRWYSPITGRYTRLDPLGLLEGDQHPYVYAGLNPLLLTDPLGFTSYKGFPEDKEQQIKEAVDRVKEKLRERPCCVSNPDALLKRLENATLVFKENLQRKGQILCGRVRPGDWFKRRMRIGGAVFQGRCGLLECTIIHELVHLRVRKAGEAAAYKAERDCFGCGTGNPPDE